MAICKRKDQSSRSFAEIRTVVFLTCRNLQKALILVLVGQRCCCSYPLKANVRPLEFCWALRVCDLMLCSPPHEWLVAATVGVWDRTRCQSGAAGRL